MKVLVVPADQDRPAELKDWSEDWEVGDSFTRIGSSTGRLGGWFAYVDLAAQTRNQPVNSRAMTMARILGWDGEGMPLCGCVAFLAESRPDDDGLVTVGVDLPAEVLQAARQAGLAVSDRPRPAA